MTLLVNYTIDAMKLRNPVYIIAWLATSALLATAPVDEAGAQLRLPGNTDRLGRLPDIELDRRGRERVEETVETTEDTVEAVDDASDTVTAEGAQLVDTVTGAAGEVVAAAGSRLRTFVGGVDADGWDIEEEIIVVMVETAAADALAQGATRLVSRRDLPALDRSLLVLKRPVNVPLPDAIRKLRDANPGAAVDYNHLYRQSSGETTRPGTPGAATDGTPMTGDAGTPRIGIVDSAVMREHRALQDVGISARDFAAHEGSRPLTHGTAVASLVAGTSRNTAAIYSASVFFQLPDHAPGATAESIAAALDWLAAERVDVVNMSLAGPGNEILEAAIAAVLDRGITVVAAVGNNGPAGAPLYPAAYDGVIGVTAVDRKNRVFRYANRGTQVDFAAPGVDVKVADSVTGGWRLESGTSMASPHVAVVAAQSLRAAAVERDALMSWLMASAEDLGRKGFDQVFGYGLITRPPVVVTAN